MTLTTGTDQTIDREVLVRIFETASRIRAFDDKAQALIGSAQAFFVHYPVRGHEPISAAVSAAIEQRDYMTATYRGLADEVAKCRPGIRVLYTSGYTDNAIVHQGRLDPGVLLLTKPYRKSQLANMIRRALTG